MPRWVNLVITLNTVSLIATPARIPHPRSAVDGAAGEVVCRCPCDLHEAHGLTGICRHTADQFVEFTVRPVGGSKMLGTSRWPTCGPCAQAVGEALNRACDQRLLELFEDPDGGEPRG